LADESLGFPKPAKTSQDLIKIGAVGLGEKSGRRKEGGGGQERETLWRILGKKKKAKKKKQGDKRRRKLESCGCRAWLTSGLPESAVIGGIVTSSDGHGLMLYV
jgi:hypothetical protein